MAPSESDPELRAQARLRLLSEAPVSMYVHDGETILFANQAFATLVGFEVVDDLVGRALRDLIYPDDYDWVKGRIRKLQAEGTGGFNARCLGRLVRTDGEIVHAEVVAAPIDFDGQPAIQVVALDVTERERAQRAVVDRDEALRRSEAQLNNAQRVAMLGSWESDLVTGELSWSAELYRIFEVDRGRGPATRDTWTAVVHPEDREVVLRTYTETIATRLPASLLYRLQMADGRIKYVHQQFENEYDDAGHPIRSIGTVQDVTAREQAVKERALLEAQLHHAQRVEALGTLAAGVAHDFNNVLTAIMANAELARREVGPAHAANESLREISIAGTRAAELIGQILKVGRHHTHEMTVVALPAIIDEALKLLRTTIPTEIEITTASSETPAISADPTQIHQVVMNLCTNAWQAIGRRGGRIDIRTDGVTLDGDRIPELPRGHYARMSVSDTGDGIDPATQARIFDPFFTTKPTGEGSGLGLAIVNGIVKGHSGVVTVTSRPGSGTTFELYFPALAPAVVTGERPRRILLVDDERAIVTVFGRSLEQLGFEVSTFTRPGEVLTVMQSTPRPEFDAIVTDHRMPGMSGVELIRALRALDVEAPLVMMSGYLGAQVREEAHALGVAGLLGKPCSVQSLVDVLERVVAPHARP